MSRKTLSSFNLAPSGPLLIVFSGLSGAGKDAVLSRMKESGFFLEYIVTLTTRAPRAQEKDNVHYHFISREEFQQMINRKELLEWASVYGNFYGVPRQPVNEALKQGRDTIVKVDVQGAATIKKMFPQAVFIFLMPPSPEEHFQRLKLRKTESSDELALRVKTAEEEIKQISLFDYVVFNRDEEIDRAVRDIAAILRAEKCRVKPRKITVT
ncbi:guanylate kinase [Chloroflexota bacterium]